MDLLEQLRSGYHHTLEHQHLALPEIHRVTGHDQLFDTLFVFCPIDAAALSSDDGLSVTSKCAGAESLSVNSAGDAWCELGLRVKYDANVFDEGMLFEVLVDGF